MNRRSIIYAIGDIHGEADRLRRLHQLIKERHAFEWPDHKAKVIHLGDYVDRGPDSHGVIEAIIEEQDEDTAQIINLRGNHEQMMLNACLSSAWETWLANGGQDTMRSYKDAGLDAVSEKHLHWLQSLPHIYIETEQKLIFVHAGIDPEIFPNERDDIYMWTRSEAFFNTESWDNPALDGWTVVHGHTPTSDFFPEETGRSTRRINIDTGAVFGGRLCAAIFEPDVSVRYIYA